MHYYGVAIIPFAGMALEVNDYTTAIANADFSSYYTYLKSQINDQSGLDANTRSDQLKAQLSDPVFTGNLARLELISRCSPTVLNSVATTSEHKAFLNWLFGDVASINKFLEGGTPRDAKALNALTIWETI